MNIFVIETLSIALFIAGIAFAFIDISENAIIGIGAAVIGAILFTISIQIEVQCNTNGTNKETLIYAVDLPSVPDDDSELEIPGKVITAKNGEIVKVPAKTIDIGEVVFTDDKSKVGIYEVKKHWKCFYMKENITYVYAQKGAN